MLRADHANIEWSAEKKRWHVVIQVGAEVIKRWVPGAPDGGDDAVRSLAVQTAKDEGYDLDAAQVTVKR